MKNRLGNDLESCGCIMVGKLTSDASPVLLREVDRRIGLIDALAACIADPCQPGKLRLATATESIMVQLYTFRRGPRISPGPPRLSSKKAPLRNSSRWKLDRTSQPSLRFRNYTRRGKSEFWRLHNRGVPIYRNASIYKESSQSS